MILCLSCPRFVHDTGSNGTLSDIRQHFHEGAHHIEMLFTPKRYLVVSGNGIRVLPKVQMECPFLWCRNGTVQYLYLKLQIHCFEVFTGNSQSPFIFSCTCISWYPNIQPDRLGGISLDVSNFYNIQHISDQRRIPFRLVRSFTTSPFLVFIQFVSHDITDEVRFNS